MSSIIAEPESLTGRANEGAEVTTDDGHASKKDDRDDERVLRAAVSPEKAMIITK